jgi:hypothetical protein
VTPTPNTTAASYWYKPCLQLLLLLVLLPLLMVVVVMMMYTQLLQSPCKRGCVSFCHCCCCWVAEA